MMPLGTAAVFGTMSILSALLPPVGAALSAILIGKRMLPVSSPLVWSCMSGTIGWLLILFYPLRSPTWPEIPLADDAFFLFVPLGFFVVIPLVLALWIQRERVLGLPSRGRIVALFSLLWCLLLAPSTVVLLVLSTKPSLFGSDWATGGSKYSATWSRHSLWSRLRILTHSVRLAGQGRFHLLPDRSCSRHRYSLWCVSPSCSPYSPIRYKPGWISWIQYSQLLVLQMVLIAPGLVLLLKRGEAARLDESGSHTGKPAGRMDTILRR
jgi:hypothetical protein